MTRHGFPGPPLVDGDLRPYSPPLDVQLTDALDRAAVRGRLGGFEVRDEDGRVDAGNWQGWLEANVRLLSDDGTQLRSHPARDVSTGWAPSRR
jgi:hypothetical protein